MFLGAVISPFKILLDMFFAYLSAISFPKIPKWLFILTILTVIERSWSLCIILLNLVKNIWASYELHFINSINCTSTITKYMYLFCGFPWNILTKILNCHSNTQSNTLYLTLYLSANDTYLYLSKRLSADSQSLHNNNRMPSLDICTSSNDSALASDIFRCAKTKRNTEYCLHYEHLAAKDFCFRFHIVISPLYTIRTI